VRIASRAAGIAPDGGGNAARPGEAANGDGPAGGMNGDAAVCGAAGFGCDGGIGAASGPKRGPDDMPGPTPAGNRAPDRDCASGIARPPDTPAGAAVGAIGAGAPSGGGFVLDDGRVGGGGSGREPEPGVGGGCVGGRAGGSTYAGADGTVAPPSPGSNALPPGFVGPSYGAAETFVRLSSRSLYGVAAMLVLKSSSKPTPLAGRDGIGGGIVGDLRGPEPGIGGGFEGGLSRSLARRACTGSRASSGGTSRRCAAGPGAIALRRAA
jgi:hypothetical protein